MNKLSGIGKKERRQLSEVLRQTKGIISVSEATDILNTDRSNAAKMLAKWAEKGWLSRLKRGLYVSIPIESRIADIPLEEPWIFAEYLYSPCYIGGWTAAEYWGLTEQIFRTIVVFTTTKPRQRKTEIKNIKYMIRTIPKSAMFGLKPIWKGEVKMLVSDPTRTLIDMLNDPALAGGVRPAVDVLKTYMNSKNKDLKLLLNYAIKMRNGAVFKRLGFLIERMFPSENETISECQKAITKGNAKLDPKLHADRLITKWKLWIPDNWAYRHK
jgi:predicted transcriptional regulator of viral defense system